MTFCVHVETVVAVSERGNLFNEFHPRHSGMDFFGGSIIPICLMGDSLAKYSNTHQSMGHPPAYVFLVQDSSQVREGAYCTVIIQKHRQMHLTRCHSRHSNQHSALKSACCKAACDFFNDTLNNQAILRAATSIREGDDIFPVDPVVAHLGPHPDDSRGREPWDYFQELSFRENEGYHSFKLPDSIFAEKRWWERSFPGKTRVEASFEMGFEGKYPCAVSISPDIPVDDMANVTSLHSQMIPHRKATVYGRQFAQHVWICDLSAKMTMSDGSVSDKLYPADLFQGSTLGLFRASKDEYFDEVTLLDEYLFQSFKAKMTMQAFHSRVVLEYRAFRSSLLFHQPNDASSSRRPVWIDFPDNRSFNKVLHHYKESHVSPFIGPDHLRKSLSAD